MSQEIFTFIANEVCSTCVRSTSFGGGHVQDFI